jgi:hypothetical protein
VPAHPPADVHPSEVQAPIAHMTPTEKARLHKEQEEAKHAAEASGMHE